MTTTYIHHSCFLVETTACYYLFDYEKGLLPAMDVTKPILVLSSHAHHDHYNAEIFTMLRRRGMRRIYAVLSSDIPAPAGVDVMQVSPNREYQLCLGQKLTTFRSTDVGVAFLIEDKGEIFYHAGDLNDWVWEGESDFYNEQMTADYREQISLLAKHLNGRTIDAAFMVLDPGRRKIMTEAYAFFWSMYLPPKYIPCIIGASLKSSILLYRSIRNIRSTSGRPNKTYSARRGKEVRYEF